MTYTTTINEKHKIILEEFDTALDKTLTAYDDVLIKRLNLKPKQITRLLEELVFKFPAIVELPLKGRRRKAFKKINPIDIFIETFEQTKDIDWFFHMAHEADPEIFKELENYTNKNKNVYKFINTLFEDIDALKDKGVFKKLEDAVRLREYRKLKFLGIDHQFDNLKCLKLVFIDNNWYLVTVGEDARLRFNRISFIESVEYATNLSKFQKTSVLKQLKFLDTQVQNSLTLYDTPLQTATLQVRPDKARYFDKNMKKFLPSQKFIKKLDDGSVIFTLDYTQPLEILPLIQKWLPNIIILNPPELQKAYYTNLNIMLSKQIT